MLYGIFALGYDILHDELNYLECDVAYDICDTVYKRFLVSDYNKSTMSEYECLCQYVDTHLEEIRELIYQAR
jgi:hypothetical protein